MTTIQLRRYELIPELVDDFLAWFPRVVSARQQHGFTVLFALHDRPGNEFTWAVSHDGDFDEVERVYMASPERAAAFEGQPKYTHVMHISKVEQVD
jgi:hypothetical protein